MTNATIDKTVTASKNSQVPNANSNPPDTLYSITGETSGNLLPEPANQPDPSNQAEPLWPPTSQPPNASHSSIPTNTNLTIMLNLDAQIEIMAMQQNEKKTKANWQKYQGYWESLSSHIKFQAELMKNISPPSNMTSTSSSHPTNTIILFALLMISSASANDFLGPTTSYQWVCPDVINFPALCSHAEKEKEKAPPHDPPSTTISHWAEVVAASVELMADNLYMPLPPEAIDVSDQLVQGVQILKHLDSLKNSSSNFDTKYNNPAPNQEFFERHHSVDVLHNVELL
ncbi:hypothetical protein VP01_4198g1 [Puccinia sorghi]|uniref:Uncharacterized protein n=1 Tax=Puccinia sorghi TaxID=27349 RepID=A0A0L6UQS2_9BASI|nr:hypothetical protein VP01_4198g1 [Puccinia sorghi]